MKEVWIVKHYSQTPKTEPIVDEVKEFTNREDALKFYMRMKRAYGWPWRFWSYPEKVNKE